MRGRSLSATTIFLIGVVIVGTTIGAIYVLTRPVLTRPEPNIQTSNLNLSSTEVGPGENVTISVDVKNAGSVKGTHTIKVKVDGETLRKKVTLEGGESRTVSFNIKKSREGLYSVRVGRLSENFRILNPVIYEMKEKYPKVYPIFSKHYFPYENRELLLAKSILKICDLNPSIQSLKKEEILYLVSPRPICGVGRFELGTGLKEINQSLQYFLEEIIPLANRIANEKGKREIKNIQQWVNENLEYGHPRGVRFKDIWEQRKGVCEDISTLIAAMSKAVGIPSRKVGCAAINHAWVEIFIDNRWIPIASTGALDSNNDWMIDQKDLHARNTSRYMYDVFTYKPFGEQKDITYAYNDFLLNNIIDKSEDILERDNYQKKHDFEKVNELLDSWYKTKSIEKRNSVGRKIVEFALKKIASVTENVPEEEVSVVEFASYEKGRDFNLEKKGKVLYFLDLISLDSPQRVLNLKEDLGQMGATFDPDPISALKCILKMEKKVKLILAGDVPFMIEVLSRKDISEMLQFTLKDDEKLKGIITKFRGKVIKVENKVVSHTTCSLPDIEDVSYKISAVGPFEYRNGEYLGHSLAEFHLIVKKNIGNFILEKEVCPPPSKIDFHFTNLVFVDENGKEHKPDVVENQYIYIPCPGTFVELEEGQILQIKTSGSPTFELRTAGIPEERYKYILWKGDLVYIKEERSES